MPVELFALVVITRRCRVAIIGCAALVLGGCASMHVGSYLERPADLSQYQSYAWGPDESGPTGDARLDNNELFDERVRRRIDEELGRHGFRPVESSDADLLVHYHVSITQKIDVRDLDRGYGSCMDCSPFVYDAGTLFIDLIDRRANRLVWRGWAESSIDGVIDNQERLNERVDEAVARILDELPVAP